MKQYHSLQSNHNEIMENGKSLQNSHENDNIFIAGSKNYECETPSYIKDLPESERKMQGNVLLETYYILKRIDRRKK